MELYVFRHGESLGNQARLFSGWAQVPLTDKGKAQADALREKVRGLTFDQAYSSDLSRALETARIALPGVPLILDTDLREINVGSLTGRSVAECEAQYGSAVAECRRTRDFTPFGGENQTGLHARARGFLSRLAEAHGEGERVAVVTHEGIITGMLSAALGVPVDRQRVWLDNCAVCVFSHTPQESWQLVRWNT